MLRPEDLIKRLAPLLGKKADSIWNTYLASDEEERHIIQHTLENLCSQLVDDYKKEKILLITPSKLEHLYGEYPVGMVWYADNSLYPFALLQTELLGHLGIFGRTGAGKSRLVRGLILTHLRLNKPLIVFDWKGTYTDLVAHPTAGVILFIPGSTTLPFHFNPLHVEGISSEHRQTYLRQVIELFIDSYLGDLKLLTVHGVESLLLIAIDTLGAQKQPLTFHRIYHFLKTFKGKARETDWRISNYCFVVEDFSIVL